MKKILLIFIFCCFYQFSYSQEDGEYMLELKIGYFKNTGKGMKGITYKIYVLKNGIENVIFYNEYDDVKNNSVTPINKSYYQKYSISSLPDKIHFYKRRWWGTGQSDENTKYHVISKPAPVFRGNVAKDIFDFSETSIEVIVKPYGLKYWYFDASGNEQKETDAVIPDNHAITLKTTKGFSIETYNWEYSLDNTNWSPFPSSVKRSNDGSEITFKGNDIPNFDPTSKVFVVRINCDTYESVKTINLKPCRSGPEIASFSSDKESCAGSGNAKVRLHLNRTIVPGEIFYVKVDDKIYEANESKILADNQTVQVEGVSAGKHVFSLWGGINGDPFFTGAPAHYVEYTIAPRPVISFPTPTHTDATCYEGADGTITFTASREAGAIFTAALHKQSSDELVDSIGFYQGESQSFTGLRAQDYYIIIKDENGCSTTRQYFTIKEPQLAVGVDDATTLQEPIGYNTKDGIIAFNITGGRGNYTAKITDETLNTPTGSIVNVGANNCVISGLGRGTYNIIITDGSYRPEFGDNCRCRYEFQYTVTAPPPIEPSIKINKHALCYSDNNGSVTVTAKGGRPHNLSMGAYDFAWYKKGDTTPFFEELKKTESLYNLLKAGEYTIVVKDANSIEASIEFTIEEPDPVLVDFVSNNIRCYNGSDGLVSVVASGGVEKYKAQLIGGENYSKEIEFNKQASAEFTELSAGNYYLYLTDMNGCPMRDKDNAAKVIEYYEIIISEPKKPVKIELTGTQLPVSYNSEDGVAVVRVSGGTTLNGGYKVSAQPTAGGTSINYSSSAKDGAYMIYTFTGLKRGRYTIQACDDNYTQTTDLTCGCVDRIDVEMVSPESMEIAIKEIKTVSCHGSNTAELMANAKGGSKFTGASMPYNYKWYKVDHANVSAIDMANDSIARNLGAGSYRVEAFDMKNIMAASGIITIQEPDSIGVSFIVNNIDCSGANTGSIKAIVQGGTAPYVYQWNVSGQKGEQISNLAMGIYTLRVTDSRGCNKVAQVEVSSTVQITVDSLVVQPNCLNPRGGRIELKLSGGSAPYSVLWLDDNSTDLRRENLSPGQYKVWITDNKGCRVPYEFQLKEPHSFSVTLPEDFTMCRNQSRTIKAECKEREVTYRWYYDQSELVEKGNSISVSKAGVYRVVVTNSAGCTAQAQLAVTMSDESLNLDMIAPTRAAVGSEIHAVNLSTVSADVLQWNLPQEAVVLKRDKTDVVFILDKAGVYQISLQGEKAGCSSLVTRTIEIVSSGDEQLPNYKQSLIKQFLVTPNPTKGYFKVMVELNKEDDFTMKLYSPSGVLVDEKRGVKVQNKSFEYEINGSIQGTYLLHLTTQYDKAVLQVVVKN